jgi:N-acetyldiaminopimelate deacetylase
MIDYNELYNIRKKLHRTPELAYNEFQTQRIIENEFHDIKELNLTRFQPTGLLYEYKNSENEYTLFRADMDALPIKENTDCDFKSATEGISHACGHDVHITILIGLMKYVVETKPKRNFLFLFQPAEEGIGGAEKIIKSGELDKYNIKSVFALHVTSQFPTGEIGIKSGVIFGIPQEFDIELFGISAHAATPHKGKDAFKASVEYINKINEKLQNKIDKTEPVIFHIGKIESGNVRNAVPDYCKLQGTTRCVKKEVKTEIINIMNEVKQEIELNTGVNIKINLMASYDPVVNDLELTEQLIKLIPQNIKVNKVETSLTGEDFGFFSSIYPSVLFWLGTNSKYDLHSDKFLPDFECINTALEIYKKLI